MPQVQQIMETALYVSDLDRSERFYRELFGFRTIFSQDRIRVLSVHDRQVLLLFTHDGSTNGASTPNGFIPGHNGRGRLHMCFGISETEILPWKQALAAKDVKLESETRGPMGVGTALYFRDPDDHLIELATPSIWKFAT
jgi:catechol 2,3-dioxygenase-like lactoylglutathione lyase family enzyme